MNNNRVSDGLRYITVRILTSNKDNTNWTGSGTGFLYHFEKEGRSAPLLVTNKHVLADTITCGLTFHVTTDNNKTPLKGPGRLITFRLDQLGIINHPDPNVDLAAIRLAPLIHHTQEKEGWSPYIKCLGASNLPNEKMLDELGALEDIIMVGYPNGLVDEINNFPILRRGVTSTPYTSDYQGKHEFLADIPVFGGSSGSPIFILNEGSYSTRTTFTTGTRFALIGVLYAGHIVNVSGQIVSQQIPTNFVAVPQIKLMVNLGICIKSSLIKDLEAQIPGW